MNALAANDFEAADLHGSKVKTAESLGVSHATIYRKIHQYGIIAPAS
jgi:transcriptional regulator of acetoin/glycerol metabolism